MSEPAKHTNEVKQRKQNSQETIKQYPEGEISLRVK